MRWGLTPISDAILMTAKRGDFSPRFFRPRAYVPGARFFCQDVVLHKFLANCGYFIVQLFFPKCLTFEIDVL